MEVVDLKRLIGALIALGAAPILAFVTLQPVAADVSVGGANACAPQSANPHPTDPAGSFTAAVFCTPASPSPSASGSAGRTNGSDSGSTASQGSGPGSSASSEDGAKTTLASTASGSTTPDESMRFDWQSKDTTAANRSGSGQQPSNAQLGSGLLAFFSGTGGLVFLYSLLVLLVLIGIAATAVAWIRRGHRVPWAEHTSRLTYRAKP